VHFSQFPKGVVHRPRRGGGLVCGRTSSAEAVMQNMQIKEYLDFLVMLIPTCVVVGAVVLTITLL